MASFPVFHGAVTADGLLELNADEKLLRRSYLRQLAGRRVDVVVRPERVQRSLDQNGYLHAHPFPLLAEHLGDSIEGTKLALMGECWGWKTSPVTGAQVPVKPRTSEMTVDECTFFIDWLIPWAAMKHGVDIPYPNEASS